MNEELLKKIDSYLTCGGMFLPGTPPQDAVGELLAECREALTAQQKTWKCHGDNSGMRYPELSDLSGGATDAQQEPAGPVIGVQSNKVVPNETFTVVVPHGRKAPPLGSSVYTTPPSGVREGLLRAAEIANAMPIYSAHDIADAIVREANLRRDAQIAKAQIDIEALRAEAERVEQTHVMVPVDLLQKIDRTAEAGLCAGTFGGCREFLKDIRAMVCSAQEGKK